MLILGRMVFMIALHWSTARTDCSIPNVLLYNLHNYVPNSRGRCPKRNFHEAIAELSRVFGFPLVLFGVRRVGVYPPT